MLGTASEVPIPSDVAARDQLLSEFTRICVQGQLYPVLNSIRVPHPTYNYLTSYKENLQGPWDVIPLEWLRTTPSRWQLLGFDVDFPFGVPASVISTTSGWIEYYARLGYNVITYKTVRSKAREAHPGPNWVFLKEQNFSLPTDDWIQDVVGDIGAWPADPLAFSMANSFGVPSEDPAHWKPDVERALRSLRSGQLLIVSVMGNQETLTNDRSGLIADFVHVAKEAEDTGARAIELNLSCPNSVNPLTGKVIESMLCNEPGFVVEVVQQVRQALKKETRLIIKLSYMSRESLERLLNQLLLNKERLIDGISGINTVQMNVHKEDHSPTFVGIQDNPTKPRGRAGVSGIAIREYGLQFVRYLSGIRESLRTQHGVDFDIIGMGGVMTAHDVQAYFQAGAQAVQAATASFFRPTIVQEVLDHWLQGGFAGVSAQMTPPDAIRSSADEFARELSSRTLELVRMAEPSSGGAIININARALYDQRFWYLDRVSIRTSPPATTSPALGVSPAQTGTSNVEAVGGTADVASLAEVTLALQQELSPRWIAFLANTTTDTVNSVAIDVIPSVERSVARRLRTAYTILKLLTDNGAVPFTFKGRPVSVETWFVAANPILDFDPPILAIRHDKFDEALGAAEALVRREYPL
ncbi:MAG TPA: hypothetical protein VF914_19930 [Chloroflexia bacterium]